MLDEDVTISDLIKDIEDIKKNYHQSFLDDLTSLGDFISSLEIKKKGYVDSTVSLIMELYRQLYGEALLYFNHKKEDIFKDIITISKKGIKGFSGTSGISSMINNTYDDFNTYILDISKLLHNIEETRNIDKNIFVKIDLLKEKINEVSKKDNSLLDKLFKIIINSKQKQS
ncbi:hypothetical protein CSA08_03100 [Candidatus Gracilibacteria bacterium]|nr:MAG: hypothetical protein CSA08_03100 [Candidatus Gracilibacteria bacterium]